MATQAAPSSFFRSIGAAALESPRVLIDRESSQLRVRNHCSLLRASRHGNASQGHHFDIGTGSSEDDWANAVARTKRREALAREKHELGITEAREREEAAEAARQKEHEEKKRYAEARQKRLEALLVAKEAKRRAKAEAARQREMEDAALWVLAVAQKKDQERENRAMMAEEQAMREQRAWRDARAIEIAARHSKQLECEAAVQAAETRERGQMACEDALAQRVRMIAQEADECKRMAAADLESRAASVAASAAAWEMKVQQSKAMLREERQRSGRETDAMMKEDLAARQVEERARELDLIRKAEVAALEAMVVAAKQREQELAAAAEEEIRHQRSKELERMESEDRQSRLREKLDAQLFEQLQWQQAIASRKRVERRLRDAEALETARMSSEDILADAVRREARKCEEQRLEAQRLLAEQAAVAAAAERAAKLQARQRQMEALEADRARAREEAIRRAEVERQAMAIEDAHGLMRQEHQAIEERRLAEQDAMSREDTFSRALRRDRRAQRDFVRPFEHEFESRKAGHRKAQNAARCHAREELEKRRQQEEARRQEMELMRAQEEGAQKALHAQRQAVEDEDARRLARKVAAEQQQALVEARRRDALLAEENRKFEELYQQNRSCLAAYRNKDLACNAAEIAAFAQKVSELSPHGATSLQLDETATFFTES